MPKLTLSDKHFVDDLVDGVLCVGELDTLSYYAVGKKVVEVSPERAFEEQSGVQHGGIQQTPEL